MTYDDWKAGTQRDCCSYTGPGDCGCRRDLPAPCRYCGAPDGRTFGACDACSAAIIERQRTIPPLIGSGQGRSARDLRESATAFAVYLWLFVACVVALWVTR